MHRDRPYPETLSEAGRQALEKLLKENGPHAVLMGIVEHCEMVSFRLEKVGDDDAADWMELAEEIEGLDEELIVENFPRPPERGAREQPAENDD